MKVAPIVGQFALATLMALGTSACLAVDEIERPPIEYRRSAPNNCVSKLQARLEQDDLRLEYDGDVGYLKSLLVALDVPVESQLLVFSKTSMQRHRISPRTPRAIYFSDDVYVGFCQSGDVLEISAVDPQLGAVFYTLDQRTTDQAHLLRQTDNCLVCHSSSRTDGVPGHLVRSLFVDPSGQPLLAAGTFSVDHTTPLENRWGGWYVTGTHGSQTHLGNLVIRERTVPRPIQNTKGQNVTQLHDRFAVDKYLTPHSDIVALMILEHQTLVQNRLAKASYVARQALHYEKQMTRALGDPEGTRLESTARRIQSAGEDLVEALLFVGEAQLTAPLSGTSGYAETFSQHGPRDLQGRSLRDLDLKQRLFQYPCSYLIYSPAFDELPAAMRDYVWKRLWEVLSQQTIAEPWERLSRADRQAIIEILRATKADLPSYWTRAGHR